MICQLLINHAEHKYFHWKQTLFEKEQSFNDKLTYGSKTILFQQWYLLALDIIESSLYKKTYKTSA